MGKKLLFTLALLSLTSELVSSFNIICYHGTWSHYRTGNGQYSISATPANLCTHYIYSFVGLDSTTNKVKLLDEWLDIGLSGFANAIALKQTNANLKVLLAVGGWSEGSAKYSTMAADATARATFIQSALELVQNYTFDGFDLDWEYPARRDSSNTADVANFASLVSEFRTAFEPSGLLVTAAVSATPASVDTSYDVSTISDNLDSINVMTYDLHGAWDNFTGHNSPLYSTSRLTGTEYADYSIQGSIAGWISRGAAAAKLTVGIPFYGRTVLLSDSSNTAPGAATTSTGGAAGPYTATAGFWGYNEIIEQFNAGGWTTAWDDEQQVPYAYNGNTWLTYDNPTSIALKVAYAKSLGLGGVIIWSIETDDFKGLSGTVNPLLTAINTAAGTSSSSDTTISSDTTSSSDSTTSSSDSTTSSSDSATSSSDSTTSSSDSSSSSESTTTSSDSTTASTLTSDTCSAVGYFRDSSDCSKYYYCSADSSGNYVKSSFTCATGTYYDTSLLVCNWIDSVTC